MPNRDVMLSCGNWWVKEDFCLLVSSAVIQRLFTLVVKRISQHRTGGFRYCYSCCSLRSAVSGCTQLTCEGLLLVATCVYYWIDVLLQPPPNGC